MRLRELMPKSLFGRALLILVFPIVVIQLTVGGIFAHRIFNEMTGIMSSNYVRVINQTTRDFIAAEDKDAVTRKANELGLTIQSLEKVPTEPPGELNFFDLTGRYIERSLSEDVIGLQRMELEPNSPYRVSLWINRDQALMKLTFTRQFVSARNPHQLPVIMVLTSLLLTGIAIFFLRNQITPIRKLATAAEAFGQGRTTPLRPRGATEVRRATSAFLGMRQRIERHIDQRTLMLSGVSHDLRTPLTRLKLSVSMLPEGQDTTDLLKDIEDMENIIDEFLNFAGENHEDQWENVNPKALVKKIVGTCERTLEVHHEISFKSVGDLPTNVVWRPTSVQRAIENLVQNAAKFGDQIEVRLIGNSKSIKIEIADNGPGIPENQRENALNAFVRLDPSRNQNKGGSVGLGLAITQDIMRSHGGSLNLGQSTSLGGLSVTLTFPRSRPD